MSGHSKWANIQHRKGRQDAKRGKEFTKAAKATLVFVLQLLLQKPLTCLRIKLKLQFAKAQVRTPAVNCLKLPTKAML